VRVLDPVCEEKVQGSFHPAHGFAPLLSRYSSGVH
jgi:hypothetical protein